MISLHVILNVFIFISENNAVSAQFFNVSSFEGFDFDCFANVFSICFFLHSYALPFSLLLHCLSTWKKKKQTQKNQGNGVPPAHIVPFFLPFQQKFTQFAQPCPLQSLPIQLFHGLPDLSWVLDEFEYTDAHSTGQTSMCRKTVSSDNLLIFLKHLQHEGR